MKEELLLYSGNIPDQQDGYCCCPSLVDVSLQKRIHLLRQVGLDATPSTDLGLPSDELMGSRQTFNISSIAGPFHVVKAHLQGTLSDGKAAFESVSNTQPDTAQVSSVHTKQLRESSTLKGM